MPNPTTATIATGKVERFNKLLVISVMEISLLAGMRPRTRTTHSFSYVTGRLQNGLERHGSRYDESHTIHGLIIVPLRPIASVRKMGWTLSGDIGISAIG